VLAIGVFSHWVLDWITHRPDMGIAPGLETRVGLGLWNSIPGTLLVELSLFAVAIAIYAKTTRAKDAVGRWALVGLVAFLLVSYFGGVFGPPPPSIVVVNVAALVATAVLAVWAVWIERHRVPS
jgi:hypothetical protein